MLTSSKLESILKLYFGSENNTTLYQKPLSYSWLSLSYIYES